MVDYSKLRNFAPKLYEMGTYILADNQELTRFALEQLIRRNEDNIIYIAKEKGTLIQQLKEHEDAVVVLDYGLLNFTDVDQLLVVSERFALSQWIIVSDELTADFLRRIIYSSHQFSIVFKDGPLRDIRDALSAVSKHERFICQSALEVILSEQSESKETELLTATETEIVRLIAQGKTTREIAAERFSSLHTITTHRKNIFRKLGVNTAHEVIKFALRAGLIDSSEFYI